MTDRFKGESDPIATNPILRGVDLAVDRLVRADCFTDRTLRVLDELRAEVLAAEQAHTPTDDERADEHQAQMVAFETAKLDARNSMRHDPHVWHGALEAALDKVLPAVWNAAAGFRRTVQGEPTPPDGWFPFGSHAPYPWVRVEFSEETDDAGISLWERPLQGEPTAEMHEHDLDHMLICRRCGNALSVREIIDGKQTCTPAVPQGEPSDAEVVEIANRAQVETGRSIWPSTVRAVLRAAGEVGR
jgi:hypothetical protein